ncbi:MAG: ribonuclease P protein component [Gammaproteobacteria bacterium]
MAGAAFPRTARLLQPREFSGIFENPQFRLSAGEVMLLAAGTDHGSARLGIVIGKKVCKHASKRNRFKRVVRESFRQQRGTLGAVDIVILARRGVAELDNPGMQQRLDTLWTRLRARRLKVPPRDSSPAPSSD